eukprot:CAMPEP_0206461784 /NCGR_PEP_ID=MMETSP0324_2-20121206/25577_1 /ASSEMBLY_ACC=CAM_ASM_000836 /TAXON_ID=2866 /ORGANISM="Crypthecodinium cohnii, Strain Seligo" /LENGTH=212 /DNA_ID=CAMNT_0053933791 /DNA_START=82 /DNA_END=720 /DNA_ORIENTATION=+
MMSQVRGRSVALCSILFFLSGQTVQADGSLRKSSNVSDTIQVWELISGDCKLDMSDAECMESPNSNYTTTSLANSTCTLRVLGNRILEVASSSAASNSTMTTIPLLSSVNLTYANGSLLEGREAGMQVFNSTVIVLGTNSSLGWKICARQPFSLQGISNGDGPVVQGGGFDWKIAVPVCLTLVVMGLILATAYHRRFPDGVKPNKEVAVLEV